MQYVFAPIFGNTESHHRAGVPFVAGISLAPVSKAFMDWAYAIGSNPIALTATDAESKLAAIFTAARDELATHNAGLKAALDHARENIEEAQKLARLPLAGDESDTILAMAVLSETAFEVPAPELSNARFLSRLIPKIDGLNLNAIIEARDTFDQERTRQEALTADLRAFARELRTLADEASRPAAPEAVAKVKLNAKLLRAAPQAIAELRTLRDEAAALAKRAGGVLETLERAV
jgi:hypothetical protein